MKKIALAIIVLALASCASPVMYQQADGTWSGRAVGTATITITIR